MHFKRTLRRKLVELELSESVDKNILVQNLFRKLWAVKLVPTAGARRDPMQGPEGSLCRAGLGLGPKGPNSSRVAKSGPSGLNPTGLKPRQTCGDYF